MSEYQEGGMYRARTERDGEVTLYHRRRATGQLAWFDITNAKYIPDDEVLEAHQLVPLDIEPAIKHFAGPRETRVETLLTTLRETRRYSLQDLADEIERALQEPHIVQPGWGEWVIASTADRYQRRRFVRFVESDAGPNWSDGASLYAWKKLLDPIPSVAPAP